MAKTGYNIVTKKLTLRDVTIRSHKLEKKYGMHIDDYLKKHVCGHEEELDREDRLREIEDWIQYDKIIKSGKEPRIEISTITPKK